MTRKVCCCSSVLSCFPCFSARKICCCFPCFSATPTTPPSPPPNTSSPILAVSNDPQSPLSPATSSSGIPGAVKHDEAPSGGASSPSKLPSPPPCSTPFEPAKVDTVSNVVPEDVIPGAVKHDEAPSAPPFEPAKDDTVPKVVPQDVILPEHDSKLVVSVASSSSSQPDASANDKVREAASSSSRNDDDATIRTVPDLTSKIEKDVGENVDLDGLVKHISQLLEIIEAGNKSPPIQRRAVQYLPTTSKSFSKLKDFLSEAINLAKDIIPSDAIKTVASGVLLGMGIGHMVTTSFVVVANMLERFEEFGDNKTECLSLLKEMYFLAKLVNQFQEHPKLKESVGMADVIKEATGLIVEGSVLCCTQMKSSNFSNFWKAPAMKEEMSKLRQKLNDMYTHMNAQMGITIYDVIAPKKPRLSRGYPEHAVGIDDAVKEVLELLEWESGKKAVAVMLHGFGGMGKTTLGDAVFSVANFEGYKYSKVQLFQNIGSKPDIVDRQKGILKDLMGPEETIPDIKTYELGYILEKAPTLIYIDNVLGANEFGQLLPRDFNRAKKVRLLLTARDLNVGVACPRKTSIKIHSMKRFSNDEAMSFLKREVLDDMEGKLNSNQIDNIIEICGGVPLMLTLGAKVLSFEEDKGKAYNMVMQGKQGVKGQLFTMFSGREDYFFAYDSLPEECKDPFLDVCAFFKGWKWETVADVVGEFELNILEKRALVTKGIDGVVSVHDVILTIGHEKAEGTRFKLTSAIQIEEIFHANEEKEDQGIKGIWLNEIKDPYIISASNLDRVCKSLRVLSIGNFTKMEGQCNKIFENLIFFQGGITHLPFDISKLKKLTYLAYEAEDLTLPKMPSSLRHVELDGRSHLPAFQISSTCFQQLGNLRILRLIRFSELKNLPQEIGDRVKALQELSLSYCKSLEEFPISISRLQYLRVLRMDSCSSLGQLAEDFGSLKSLQELNLEGCLSLRQLGEGFGSLNSLQELNLKGCTALKELPNNFEKLSSLRSLNLSHCENLEDLPHGLGKLSSLVALHFHHCHKLKSIPDSIGQLKLLVPFMDVSYCLSLTELPDGFCNLSFITELHLSHCKSLHRLPNRFGELASLRVLVLDECSSLQKLPESFGQLKYLEQLDLSGCKSLEELCNEFHCLSSLHGLSMSGCESLEKLPEDFHCLISLRHLDLSFCPMLEGKSMDKVIKINALKIVGIEGSGMLEDRWAEIERESDKSWPFKVFTRQGFSTDENEKIQKDMLTQLEFLLSEGRGKPFHLSGHPLVIILDDLPDYNHNFPWPLIEETIDDIQINFEMVYVGDNFDKLPPKAKINIIVGHVNDPNFYVTMAYTLGLELDKLGIVLMTMQLEDGEGGKCRPSWKVLTKGEMEEFVLCKCRKYLQLKQLAETSQESTINLLRELFATGEEQTCTFQKVPSGNSKPLTCTSQVLKGKTILLEMRPLDVCYDIRLASLTQLYNTQKDTLNLEIISIPLVHRSSSRRFDVFEQFSRDIPWLIIQNPWAIPTAVKYFLLKSHKTETSSPSLMKIIEPNGRICPVSESVFRVLDIWGAKLKN